VSACPSACTTWRIIRAHLNVLRGHDAEPSALKAAHSFAGKGHVSAYGSLARDGAQIYRGVVWGRIHGAQTLYLHSGSADMSNFFYKKSNSDR
jgi:hypothetical protein